MKRLLEFARRANLARVLTVYLSAAFVALQLVDMFAARLPVPPWLFPLTLIVIIVGLPLTVVAAVSYARRRAAPAPQHAAQDLAAGRPRLTWQRVGLMVLSIFALWGLVAAAWLVIGPVKRAPKAAAAATGSLRVTIEPTTAQLTARAVLPIDSFAQRAPVAIDPDAKKLPVGEYVITASAPGHNTVAVIVRVARDSTSSIDLRLIRDDPATRDMVYVPAGSEMPAFLIDRHEVSNAAYLEFVRARGYDTETLRGLVDRTGTPGPRGWSGGLYPEGQGDLPVGGITWKEATAYARWRGKQLPTWNQWWHAALTKGRIYPWGNDAETLSARANFNLESVAPAGAHLLGVSWVGAHDMAGNVREWLRDTRGDATKHVAVGGSWQDPNYLFDPQWVEGFAGDYASETIGFRCVKETK